MNSSPPSRATVSLSRTQSPSRSRDIAAAVVAGLVAEGVVDDLEAVEVEQHHRNHLFAAVSARHRLVQAVVEQDAVGKLGQRIVVGQVMKAFLVGLDGGDVGKDGDIMGGVAEVVHDGRDG